MRGMFAYKAVKAPSINLGTATAYIRNAEIKSRRNPTAILTASSLLVQYKWAKDWKKLVQS